MLSNTMKYLTLLLIFLSSFSVAENKIIKEINVNGNYIFSKKQIISMTPFFGKINYIYYPSVTDSSLNKLINSGYFQAVDINIVSKNKIVIVNINVTENPVVLAIKFSGLSSFSDEYLRSLMQTTEKRILNYNYLSEDISSINIAFAHKGMTLSGVNQITISNNILHLKISEPVIENVIISGNFITEEYLLLREVNSHRGDIYNYDTLLQDRMRLLRLGYFSSVSLPQILPGTNKNAIDIVINVKEKELNHLNIGVGFTSYESFGFLKLTFLNYLNMGEEISFETQVGQQYGREMENYALKYYNPWFFYRQLGFGYTNYWRKGIEIIDNSLVFLQRSGYNIDFDIPVIGPKYRFRTTYRDEYIKEIQAEKIDYFKKSLALTFSYDNRSYFKNSLAIARGEFLKLHHEVGGEITILGGSIASLGGVSYLKQELDYKRFITTFFKNHILAFSIRGGLFNAIGDHGFFVDAEKYSVGGGNSVRGTPDYRPFATGVKKLILNIEYRILLWGKIEVVTFFDAGNAFNEISEISNFYKGYGFGLRYITPIGNIRGDFAFSPDYEEPVFHFGLGEIF